MTNDVTQAFGILLAEAAAPVYPTGKNFRFSIFYQSDKNLLQFSVKPLQNVSEPTLRGLSVPEDGLPINDFRRGAFLGGVRRG